MPASHERVPNRPLSGRELGEIIKKDAAALVDRDGMFNNNIAYGRVSYELRITMHVDNPIYPEHISKVLSKRASIQEVEAKPELASIEIPPLAEPSEEDTVVSLERQRTIASPNAARVEHDMPLIMGGHATELQPDGTFDKKIKYTGDKPDPASVGNITSDKDVSESQRSAYGLPKKGGKK